MTTNYSRFADALRRSEVVACPTETLVGLLADAYSDEAVGRVLALKGRRASAIALLIPELAWLDRLAERVPAEACTLMERYWPGPLTLVVRARPGLPAGVAPDGTVGVRIPGPSPALSLVRAFGGPLTATSANPSGAAAASSEAEARAYFGAGVAAYVPGASPGGAPSTLVDATGPVLRVLREGALVLGPDELGH